MDNDTTQPFPSSASTTDSVPSQGNLWRTAKRVTKLGAFVALGVAASAFHHRIRR